MISTQLQAFTLTVAIELALTPNPATCNESQFMSYTLELFFTTPLMTLTLFVCFFLDKKQKQKTNSNSYADFVLITL